MKLPTKRKAIPPPSIDGDMFLIIGEPKAGKSTFVNQVPDSLVIDTQSGHSKLGGCVLDLREAGADPLATFGEVLSQLQKDCPYQAVAIDTLDDLSVMAEELATQRCNVKLNMKETGVGQFTHGIGWVTHREIVMTMLTKIRALPCTTILVAHNKRMIDEETSEVSKVLDLPGKLAHWVPGEVDHIAIASRSKKKGYTLSFEGYEHERSGKKTIMQAGSRLKALNGKVIETSWAALLEAVKGGSDGSA